MSDLNPLSETTETPEDVATLYSWANLHGAKYRDFSASRAQTRERARLRAEQAMEEAHRASLAEAGNGNAAHADWALEEAKAAEAAHQILLPDGNDRSEPEVGHQILLPDGETLAADAAAQQTIEAAPIAEETPAVDLEAEQKAEQARAEAAQAEAAKAEEAKAEQARAEALAAEQAAEEQAKLEAAQKAAAEEAARAAEAESARQAEEQKTIEAAKIEADRLAAEQAAAKEAEEQARVQAAKEAEEQAKIQAAREAEERAELERAAQQKAELVKAAQDKAAQELIAQQTAAQELREQEELAAAAAKTSTVATEATDPPNAKVTAQDEPSIDEQSSSQLPAQTKEENHMPSHTPWATHESQEANGRPAWLNSEKTEVPIQPIMQAAAQDDTLQASRDRLTSRWFALRGIFDGTPAPIEPTPQAVVATAPVLAVFSLAGGVGKTSLVATLGRALSAKGERVLLVDTAAFGLLPFFFGATDQRPGVLRTFNPPGLSNDAPIQMLTVDPDGLDSETATQDGLSGEIGKFSRGAGRVIVDLATASGATTRRIMRMSPLVLVPVIADMNSVVSVSSIDAFFEHNSNPTGKPSMPYYLLNQFDASLPLHLDVREVLREQLGDRLLPFAMRRTPAMSEALAEGMTVIDYAPGSQLSDDFSTLAGWVKSLSAPATASYRGVRWSER